MSRISTQNSKKLNILNLIHNAKEKKKKISVKDEDIQTIDRAEENNYNDGNIRKVNNYVKKKRKLEQSISSPKYPKVEPPHFITPGMSKSSHKLHLSMRSFNPRFMSTSRVESKKFLIYKSS